MKSFKESEEIRYISSQPSKSSFRKIQIFEFTISVVLFLAMALGYGTGESDCYDT